jgi:hypothetical protein
MERAHLLDRERGVVEEDCEELAAERRKVLALEI